MGKLLSLSVLFSLISISTCVMLSHCPRGNCTADFATIVVSCKDLNCEEVPLLDKDTAEYLKTLELQNNAISELPEMDFGQMDTLNLSYNQLRWIEDQVFVKCEMLDEVDLSHNRIQDVASEAFYRTSMSTIDLSFNQLSKIPAIRLRALDLLNMSHNAIAEVLDSSFYDGGLDKLQSLDMSYNQIEKIYSDAFYRLWYLNDLHLQGNKLTALTDNVFHSYLTRLRYLDLSNNELESLTPNALTDLENLKYLDLSNNKLKDLQEVHFLGLERLENLYLQNNQLQNLTEGLFSECDSLSVLDVSSNPVAQVHPDLFVHKLGYPIPIGTLRMNDLEHVTEIFNKTFWGLLMLETVEISHNVRLESIQPGAFHPQATDIKVLNLRYNKLSTISDLLVNWTLLEDLDVSGNVWDCNCDLVWLKGQQFPERFERQVTCVYPTFLQGQSVDKIPESRFSCNYLYENKREGAIIMVLIFTIVFMTVGGVVLHKYRHTVFPCFYSTPMYRSFYNPLYTDEKDCEKVERAEKVTVINEPTAL